MVDLEMFDTRLADTIAGWSADPDATMMWCSLSAVTGDVVAGWSDDAHVEAYVLCDDGDPVAYGELWVDADENEVELAHVIVEPGRRGDGLGRRLVAGLVDQARRHYPVVSMRVHSQNEAAVRAYRAAGFVRASPAEERTWNEGQPTAYVWMTWHAPQAP